MKTIVRAAAIAATLALSATASAAFAADAQPAPSTGHFEWRSQPSYGPRAPTRAPVRVWVSDSKMMAADCDCSMMRGPQAANCMTMPSARNPARQG